MPEDANKVLQLFVDGSGESLGGVGGWAAVVVVDGNRGAEFSGSIGYANNQTAELTAILEGLRAVPEGWGIEVVSDSESAIRWLTGMYRRRNPEVIRLCGFIEDLVAARGLSVKYTHIRGHNGHIHNSRADYLAGEARRRAQNAQAR